MTLHLVRKRVKLVAVRFDGLGALGEVCSGLISAAHVASSGVVSGGTDGNSQEAGGLERL